MAKKSFDNDVLFENLCLNQQFRQDKCIDWHFALLYQLLCYLEVDSREKLALAHILKVRNAFGTSTAETTTVQEIEATEEMCKYF